VPEQDTMNKEQILKDWVGYDMEDILILIAGIALGALLSRLRK